MEQAGVGYLAAPATKSRDITGIVLTISRNTHHRHDTTPCQNIPRLSAVGYRRFPIIIRVARPIVEPRRFPIAPPLVRPSVNPYRFSRETETGWIRFDSKIKKKQVRAQFVVGSLFEDLFLRTGSRWFGRVHFFLILFY